LPDTKSTQPEEKLDTLKSRLSELEELLAKKEQELGSKESRISELEAALSSKESEIGELKQSLVEFNHKIGELKTSLSEVTQSYKTQVLTANPDVPEELISGENIEAINTSLASARELVSRVRKGVEAEISNIRFPAGAPERTPPDLSGLSPREKIQYAIGGKNQWH